VTVDEKKRELVGVDMPPQFDEITMASVSIFHDQYGILSTARELRATKNTVETPKKRKITDEIGDLEVEDALYDNNTNTAKQNESAGEEIRFTVLQELETSNFYCAVATEIGEFAVSLCF
jgi:hypothetical protein